MTYILNGKLLRVSFQCVFQPGFGFKRGGYSCICRNGYLIKGELVEGKDQSLIDQALFYCLPRQCKSLSQSIVHRLNIVYVSYGTKE